MKSYNNVTLVGTVIVDTKLKEVSGTEKRATFTLGVDRSYKNSEGKHPTDFFNIVVWGKLAEIAGDYVKKGGLILVTGKIQSRSYTIDDEVKWITEIVGDSINILEYPKPEKTKEKAAVK